MSSVGGAGEKENIWEGTVPEGSDSAWQMQYLSSLPLLLRSSQPVA